MPGRDAQRALSVIVVVAMGASALGVRWLAAHRLSFLEGTSGTRLYVTSGKDEGPGSLREAIFAAARLDARAAIVIRAARISLESPLPPLVNQAGVDIDTGESGSEIDARQLPVGPVIEIRAPRTTIEGLRIHGAAGAGLLVRARGVQLRRVAVVDSAEGVTMADGAGDVLVEDSRFERNGTGVHLALPVPNVIVRRNDFARHEQAAVWAVTPAASAAASAAGLSVRANRFADDRISVVSIHVGGRIEQNQFSGAREAAIYVMGRNVIVRENRTRDGAGLGIFADETDGALVEANEVDRNAAVGIILRSSGGTVIQNNRVYGNGYGIAVVFGDGQPSLVRGNLLLAHTQDALYVVGASPLIRQNRALQSRVAALRILDFVPLEGLRLPAVPRLVDNVFQDNLVDAPVRGVYRVRPAEGREEP